MMTWTRSVTTSQFINFNYRVFFKIAELIFCFQDLRVYEFSCRNLIRMHGFINHPSPFISCLINIKFAFKNKRIFKIIIASIGLIIKGVLHMAVKNLIIPFFQLLDTYRIILFQSSGRKVIKTQFRVLLYMSGESEQWAPASCSPEISRLDPIDLHRIIEESFPRVWVFSHSPNISTLSWRCKVKLETPVHVVHMGVKILFSLA